MTAPVRAIALVLVAALAFGAARARASDRTAQLEDIAAFRREILAVDPSFTPAARVEAEQRLARLGREVGALDDVRFAVELCGVVALADNGHTNCLLESLHAPTVPVSFFPLRGGLFVLSADEADADLLGARLVAVDGRPIADIRELARRTAGGVPAFRDVLTSGVYARPELLHGLGVARRPDAAAYRLILPDGRSVTRELTASKDAATAPRAKPPPATWAFQDPAQPFRWRDAPAHDAIVVQIRRTENGQGMSLAAFLDEVERRRAEFGRKNVVLDMRSNDGGDFILTRDFMSAWPGRLPPGGRFAVLIGTRTFSAGMATIAYLKQAGGDRVILVGQPPGDRMTFFAENHTVRLPHSGLAISTATARDDLAGGCRKYADCFAGLAQPGAPTGSPPEVERAVRRMPLEVRSLAPDIRVAMGADDWLAGRDPAMARALSAVGDCQSRSACEAETTALAGAAG